MASKIRFENADPFKLFDSWYAEATEKEINDPNAMSLSTVDQLSFPNVRIVLMKEFNSEGFVFYTNTESAKGIELQHSKKAAICFHWKSLRRQVRIRGEVHNVLPADADQYFNSRSRKSQLGAWASKQSQALENRRSLLKEVARYTLKFGVGKIPRPPHWSGYCIKPNLIEFWQDEKFRLHNRHLYTYDFDKDRWGWRMLQP